MIFLDTSAIYAVADTTDPHHEQAVAYLDAALRRRESVLTHNYVVIESAALIQRRLGLQAALAFLDGIQLLQVHWVTRDEHQKAVSLLKQRSSRSISLVDCMSFVVMKQYGVTVALAYDADFQAEGFESFQPTWSVHQSE